MTKMLSMDLRIHERLHFQSESQNSLSMAVPHLVPHDQKCKSTHSIVNLRGRRASHGQAKSGPPKQISGLLAKKKMETVTQTNTMERDCSGGWRKERHRAKQELRKRGFSSESLEEVMVFGQSDAQTMAAELEKAQKRVKHFLKQCKFDLNETQIEAVSQRTVDQERAHSLAAKMNPVWSKQCKEEKRRELNEASKRIHSNFIPQKARTGSKKRCKTNPVVKFPNAVHNANFTCPERKKMEEKANKEKNTSVQLCGHALHCKCHSGNVCITNIATFGELCCHKCHNVTFRTATVALSQTSINESCAMTNDNV